MIQDGDRVGGLLDDYDCIARAVHPTNVVLEHLNSAIWYWNRSSDGIPPVIQLVWPDVEQGLFPWEERCAEYAIDLQPPLWLDASMD